MYNKTILYFKAKATCDSCIEIKINPDLILENAKIKVLGENRNLLAEITNPSYQLDFCIYTGRPMFIELHTQAGVAVHYVEGSGKDFYQSNN
jgi:hypothetical protein